VAVLGDVGCFAGALEAPVEVGTGAVVVGQDDVDEVGPVGVLGERERVGHLVGPGVDRLLHVGREADEGETGPHP